MKQTQLQIVVMVTALSALYAPALFAVDYVYDPYDPPHLSFCQPIDYSFKVYKDETVAISFIYDFDKDRQTDYWCPDLVTYYDASPFCFSQDWTITGEASFSPTTTVTTDIDTGLYVVSKKVYIDPTFGSGDTITITMELNDSGANGPPGTDSDGEPADTLTWTLAFKDKCPTDVTCTSPANCTAWRSSDPATYWYELLPDVSGADYPDISIHEEFGTTVSNIDKNTHVTAAGRTAHPSYNNDDWKDYYFASGVNASVTPIGVDSDVIGDQLEGFAMTFDYMVNPLPAELWWRLPQTLKCNSGSGNLSKSYIIERKYENGDNYYTDARWIRKY